MLRVTTLRLQILPGRLAVAAVEDVFWLAWSGPVTVNVFSFFLRRCSCALQWYLYGFFLSSTFSPGWIAFWLTEPNYKK